MIAAIPKAVSKLVKKKPKVDSIGHPLENVETSEQVRSKTCAFVVQEHVLTEF